MPQFFKDNAGNEWQIALPFGTVLRVRAESEKRVKEGASKHRFDLLEPFEEDLQNRLLYDVVAFWELLQILTEPQAVARGITAEQFGEAMTADCLVEARRLFWQEWSDFFQKSQRHDVAEALAKIYGVQAKAIEMLLARIASDPTINEMGASAEKKLESELNGAFDTLRRNVDFALTVTPGENSPPSMRYD
jgi:hypothetical protein